jgi:hypothetical protein
MSNAGIDENSRQTLTALSNANDGEIVALWADPGSHRLLIDTAGSSNIVLGTSTITGTGQATGQLLYDNAGVVGELALATYPSLTEISYVKGVTSAIQTQINAKGAGTVTAVSVATANGFSGSSSGGATPALTIVAGAIVPTSVNGLTITTTTGTFTLTNAKTLTVSDSTTLATSAITLGNGKVLTLSNTLTLSGTDSTTMTFPTTSATIARTDAAQTFTGVQTFSTPIAVGSVATMTATVGGGVPTPPNNTTTFLRGDGTFATPVSSSPMTLLKANTGTSNNTSANNLDTIAITGLTAKDTLFVRYTLTATIAAGGTVALESDTDTLTLINVNAASPIGLNRSVGGTAYLTQEEQSSTGINATASDVITTIGEHTLTTGQISGYSQATSTAWTGSWTLALKSNGVTSTGNLNWSWAVYKIAGQ